MALVPNLRTYDNTTFTDIPTPIIGSPHALNLEDAAPKRVEAKPQAYLDTPSLVYSKWNEAAGGIDKPLGTLSPTFSVCLIGGGISNLAAAFELAKAGATVTLYEAEPKVGGRMKSWTTEDNQNVAEMGAMRFPPSEDLLYYYAHSLGFSFMSGFPDPGVVPTILSYQGVGNVWANKSEAPTGFETVFKGWNALCDDGIKKDGKPVLQPANQLHGWLKHGRGSDVPKAWQAYLDTFKGYTFYEGLQRIFGPNADWDVPGVTKWSRDDFSRFGALGVGSGGFGSLYDIAFNTVFRLIPNGLETDQAIFCTAAGAPTGIQQLAFALRARAIAMGASIVTNTVADVVRKDPESVRVSITPAKGPATEKTFDFVIVGVTTKTMAVNMEAVSDSSLFGGESITDGINAVHITSSSKLFIRTKRFWAGQVGHVVLSFSGTNI
jgi:tryptophan 2-monooxygenase